MSQQHPELSQELIRFIWQQQMFFVASAPNQGHINLSPKGLDSFRVLGPKQVAWLNVTGSGNETAAHVLENGRMTIMFCAFTGKPVILRLYGQARVIHPRDAEWIAMLARFEALPGARQIFVLEIDLILTSCGMAVPLYEYQGQRSQLIDWAQKKGQKGMHEYWDKKNRLSIDGLPTKIFEQ